MPQSSQRPPVMEADVQEVSARLRSRDLDAWLATLLARPDDRPRLFALWAFAADVLDLPWQVSEPALGLIRLQWWIDALEAPYPAPFALGRVLHTCLDEKERLALQPFVQGQAALFEGPFDMERAVSWTQTLKPLLACIASDQGREEPWLHGKMPKEVARAEKDETRLDLLCRVWGFAQLLRRAPFKRRNGLPLLAEDASVRTALLDALARDLAHMRRLPRPPRECLAALLPVGMSALWLKAARKAHTPVPSTKISHTRTSHPILHIAQPRRQLWLLSHWLRGRIA